MATDINNLNLIGRITQDIGADERSFGYTANGLARANISIVVNRNKKSGDKCIDEVSYFPLTLWGKTAENLKPYLKKGKQIAIQGYLRQERWERDSQKQSRLVIVAENVQLLGNSSGHTSKSEAQPKQQFTPIPPATSPAQQQELYNADDFPEDIPF